MEIEEKYIGKGNPCVGKIKSLFFFPNNYEVGMSSLAFHFIYEMLAMHQDYSVERAFFDAKEKEILSYERNEKLKSFDVIFISVSFELDYINIFLTLKKSGLLENIEKRNEENFPIIIVGGAAVSLNPEILANYVDIIYIGEAETNMVNLLDKVSEGLTKEKISREEILKNASKIDGVYVPSLFNPIYSDENKFVGFKEDRKVKRQIKEDLKLGAKSVFLTKKRAFSSEFLIETGRGCEQGCRFCMSAFSYKPARKFDATLLKNTIDEYAKFFNSVGLVGAAVSSHPKIIDITNHILSKSKSASFSSLRADYLSEDFIDILSRMNIKTISLAPEVGSEDLRFGFGKKIKNECFYNVIRQLSNIVKTIRFYFMVGLPNETEDDVKKIVTFIENARKVLDEEKKNVKLFLSVNPFIPKAFTPYEKMPMLPEKDLKKRFEIIKKGIFKVKNVDIKIESLKESFVQGLFSRGDRRVGDILKTCVESDSQNIGDILRLAKKIFITHEGKNLNLIDFYVHTKFNDDLNFGFRHVIKF